MTSQAAGGAGVTPDAGGGPGDAPAPAPAPEPGPVDQARVELARVRELVLQANPDVVAEMVGGDSFDSLLASVDAARAAYRRIAGEVSSSTAAGPPATAAAAAPPSVPAGQPGRQPYTSAVEDLSPAVKIAEGLKRRGAG